MHQSPMKHLDYRDFEIEIAPGDGDDYPVAVLRSPSGQARDVMRLPFASADLALQLQALERALSGATDATEKAAAQLVQRFGAVLFEALMRDRVRGVYDMSRQATKANGQGLRIKLRMNAPELATIPWEFLYDPRPGEFVALSRYTPMVRYLELPLPDPELAVEGPLRILGMIANPTDTPPLDTEREKARMEKAVRKLRENGLVELAWLGGQTWRDLQVAMQGGPWHIFHFVGHAKADSENGVGFLLLADDYGDAAPLGATDLARLLADHRTLRLVLLNACQGARGNASSTFSSIASILVQRGLPAVLAMQYEISDEAAIEFTTSFYQALLANLPIDAAVSEARKAISLALPGSMEWGIPALFIHAPDGVIWKVEKDGSDVSTDIGHIGQYWWDKLPATIGDFNSGDIGGDVIIATVGAGAKNVTVGKNNIQTITEVLGEATPDDRQIIETGLTQVKAELGQAEGEIGESAAKMARGLLAQIENELLKTGADETPNGAIITQMGDLLLNSVPQLSASLRSLFATPAVGRVVGRSGETAVTWVRGRFGAAND